MVTKYHALSADAWDAEDLGPGDHQGTFASELKDGHGRVVRTTERVRDGEHRLVESRHVDTTYLPTGEPTSITRSTTGKTPVMRTMSYDSLGRMVENIEASTSREEAGVLHTWRYAYSQAGDLVGTSDARGCGTNYYYDSSGRLTIEDYAPCEAHHGAVSQFVPEVLYSYDSFGGDPDAAEVGPGPCNTKGRLVSVIDRGGKVMTCFDSLGRTTAVARQLTTPSGALGGRWYHRTAEYDTADRPVLETTGASVNGTSSVTTTYTRRGTVGTVGSSYGALVNHVTRDADGLVQEIEYGDAAATTTGFMYDELRRLRNLTTYRARPQLWPTTGTGTQQLLLQDEQYTYDRVGNPTEIRDWRIASEWNAGAKPVTRKLKYDDLYRLSRIEYQYPQGSDDWVDPFAAELLDITRPQPVPHANLSDAKRPLWQTYEYDWLGNTLNTDDDAHAFYDRSLGAVTNDGYQLSIADNVTKGGSHTGHLDATYDASGNLVTMDVARAGVCIPANKCTIQHYDYEWDEVGRLVRARRFDMSNPPSGTPPDAELSYRYDASDNRVLKTVGNRYTAYIFGSLELRGAAFDGDYELTASTETVYLQGHGVRLARVVNEVPDPYDQSLPTTRVFLELGDQLGSTSVVLDRATGELVERSTAYAYGATESDYRPERWCKFREDYRFTGKEEDIEVGLQYFGKRFYAPLLQRWISPDPLAVHAPGQADLNLYAYVHGRVLVAVDPVGLEPTVVQTSEKPAGLDIKAGDYFAMGSSLPGGQTVTSNAADFREATRDLTVIFQYSPNAGQTMRQATDLAEAIRASQSAGNFLSGGPGGSGTSPDGHCTGGADCLGGGTMKSYSGADKFAMGVGMVSGAGADPGNGVTGGVPGGTGDPAHAGGAGQAAWGAVQLFGHKAAEAVAKGVLRGGGMAVAAVIGAVVEKRVASVETRVVTALTVKEARKVASERGGELVKQFKLDGVGAAAGRSSGHGTPHMRAGNQLIQEANRLPKNDPMREALKVEGKRLINQGKAINH